MLILGRLTLSRLIFSIYPSSFPFAYTTFSFADISTFYFADKSLGIPESADFLNDSASVKPR